MSVLWHQQEVDIITGARSSMPWSATDLTIRADDVRPGDLFFASAGDDLTAVFELGAAAAIVPAHMPIPKVIEQGFPILKVPCAYEALRALARASRERTHSLVIAVQGFEQRKSFSRALGAVADYYEGGRHLSSAMAAMPHNCEFSVFSLSPSLRPDIAVIDRPSMLRAGNLFDTMPQGSIVMLNSADPAYIDVLAQARSNKQCNVLTYGGKDSCDIQMLERISASNGLLARCCILGQEVSVQIPLSDPAAHADQAPLNMLLAALGVAKLADMNIQQCAWPMGQVYLPDSRGAHTRASCSYAMDAITPNITLMGSAPTLMNDEAVFRVKNMIDIGRKRKTLILDHAAPTKRERDFNLPTRFGGLDVVCATRKVSVFKNAQKAIERLIKGVKLQHIVPEVLTPGDYVVFKSSDNNPNLITTQALRAR